MTKTTLMKAFTWELSYGFRGLVHDHHNEKQTGMVLGQKLRALYPD